MKRTNLVFKTSILIMLILPSAACSSTAAAVPDSTVMLEPAQKVVSTVAPSATPSPVQIATPPISHSPMSTESPTYVIGADEDLAINRKMQDFINFKGKYSKEYIKKFLYPSKDSFYNLGIIYGDKENNKVQGWLFGYTKQGDNLYLIVGFDSNIDDRFVTLLNIPLFIATTHKIGGVNITYQSDWSQNAYFHSGEYTRDYEVIISHLAWDQPFLFFLHTDFPSDEEARKSGVKDESSIELLHERRNNLQYTYNLLSRLNQNNQTISIPSIAADDAIYDIDEVSDIIELNSLKIPILYTVVCID